MAAVGDKQDLVWFPLDTRATALNLSCTAYWEAKFTPRLETRLVNWAEYLAKMRARAKRIEKLPLGILRRQSMGGFTRVPTKQCSEVEDSQQPCDSWHICLCLSNHYERCRAPVHMCQLEVNEREKEMGANNCEG